MAERGLAVDHVTIWRWVQHYAPLLNQGLRRELRRPNGSWRVDETYIKVAGKWTYLYRAVDSSGDTIDFMTCRSCNSWWITDTTFPVAIRTITARLLRSQRTRQSPLTADGR
jgi:hypothetical protein